MEKDGAKEEQASPTPLERELSTSESHDEAEPQQNAMMPTLSRTTTGPPYSIFSHKAKIFIVMSVSLSSLISPFGATTFYPALNVLAADLHVTPSLINLSLTTYMVCPPLSSQDTALLIGAVDRSSHCAVYHCRNV